MASIQINDLVSVKENPVNGTRTYSLKEPLDNRWRYNEIGNVFYNSFLYVINTNEIITSPKPFVIQSDGKERMRISGKILNTLDDNKTTITNNGRTTRTEITSYKKYYISYDFTLSQMIWLANSQSINCSIHGKIETDQKCKGILMGAKVLCYIQKGLFADEVSKLVNDIQALRQQNADECEELKKKRRRMIIPCIISGLLSLILPICFEAHGNISAFEISLPFLIVFITLLLYIRELQKDIKSKSNIHIIYT